MKKLIIFTLAICMIVPFYVYAENVPVQRIDTHVDISDGKETTKKTVNDLDKNGRIISYSSYDVIDGKEKLVGKNDYEYDENGNTSKSVSYSVENGEAHVSGVIEYCFNSDGKPTKEDFKNYDYDGNVTAHNFYIKEYDEHGNAIRLSVNRNGGNGESSFEILYENIYDDEGRLSRINIVEDGKIQVCSDYDYTDGTTVTTFSAATISYSGKTKTVYDDDGNMLLYGTYTLDGNGEFEMTTKSEYSYENGEIICTQTMQLSENGEWVVTDKTENAYGKYGIESQKLYRAREGGELTLYYSTTYEYVVEKTSDKLVLYIGIASAVVAVVALAVVTAVVVKKKKNKV